MFFDNWTALARVVVVGLPAYFALILWLRISGKRTLSKWNAFDFIVTVALGSTLATVLLTKEVALAEGVLAFGLLVLLQFLLSWLSVHSSFVRGVIKAEPTLLLHKGNYVHDAMREQRVTESEILAAVRGAGIADLGDVEAVVLETDGSVSVVKPAPNGGRSALADVAHNGGRA